MKNTLLKHKFKAFNFVKPLYRKVGKVKPKKTSVNIDVDNTKLRGDGFCVKRYVFCNKSVDFDLVTNKYKNSGYRSLPGTCEKIQTDSKINKNSNNDKVFIITNSRLGKMSKVSGKGPNEYIQENKLDKSVQAMDKVIVPQEPPRSWLKMYPAPALPDESIGSIIFRCLVCQLGMACFLVLWTLLWVFIINSYEEPNELAVSLEFQKQQNQLVIDLATELRQITPLAPKWLNVIEQRIEEERRLTVGAMIHGALLHPGHHWHLAGTFLFNIYVMTALGFGAPIPQTLWGKTAGLIYATLAVPVHLYLMVNLSTSVVSKVDCCMRKRREKEHFNINQESLIRTNTDSPNCRRKEFTKTKKTLGQKILHSLEFLRVGRFVPLAAVLYYSLGAITFGVLRGKKGLDVAMFPLEFTTSGGLEHVEDYVRILYGFYVEGAIMLLSYMLATIRLCSSSAASYFGDHYQLYEYESSSNV